MAYFRFRGPRAALPFYTVSQKKRHSVFPSHHLVTASCTSVERWWRFSWTIQTLHDASIVGSVCDHCVSEMQSRCNFGRCCSDVKCCLFYCCCFCCICISKESSNERFRVILKTVYLQPVSKKMWRCAAKFLKFYMTAYLNSIMWNDMIYHIYHICRRSDAT